MDFCSHSSLPVYLAYAILSDGWTYWARVIEHNAGKHYSSGYKDNQGSTKSSAQTPSPIFPTSAVLVLPPLERSTYALISEEGSLHLGEMGVINPGADTLSCPSWMVKIREGSLPQELITLKSGRIYS